MLGSAGGGKAFTSLAEFYSNVIDLSVFPRLLFIRILIILIGASIVEHSSML